MGVSFATDSLCRMVRKLIVFWCAPSARFSEGCAGLCCPQPVFFVHFISACVSLSASGFPFSSARCAACCVCCSPFARGRKKCHSSCSSGF